MSKRRKVKFGDSVVREVSCNDNVPSLTTRRDMPLIDESAKTSEYKYFRKLQEESSNIHKVSTVPLCDTKISKVKNKSEETYAMLKSKLDNSSSSAQEKGITVAERYASPVKATEIKEKERQVAFKDDARTSLVKKCAVTPVGQSLPFNPEETWNSDVEYQCEESFYGKRRKLLQLVAGSLSSEGKKHMLCRSDLIPFLLQRIGISRTIDSQERLLISGEVFPERCTHKSYRSGTIHQLDDVKNMSCSAFSNVEHLSTNFTSPGWNIADELKMPTLDITSCHNFSNFGDGLLQLKHSNWNVDEQEGSEQNDRRRSYLRLEWSNDEDSKNQCRDIDPSTSKLKCSIPDIQFERLVMPYEKSTFSELTDLPNSQFAYNDTEQSVMPNAKSNFSELTDLPNNQFAYNVREQSVLPYVKSKFLELTDLPNNEFAYNVTEQSLMPYLKPKFSELTDLPNDLFSCNITEQSLVPYNKSKSPELTDCLSQMEKSVIPLPNLEMTEIEPEFPFASKNLVHMETDDWPLSYVAFSSFRKLKDGLEGCNAFYSPLRSKYPMFLEDSTFRRFCPISRRLELERKSLPSVSENNYLLLSNKIKDQQLYQYKIQDGNYLMASDRNKFGFINEGLYEADVVRKACLASPVFHSWFLNFSQ